MQNITQALGILLLSATKFFLAPSTAVYLGYSLLNSIFLTTLGGIIGFFLFFKFGIAIRKSFQLIIKPKKKKMFSRTNRIIVKVRSNYGLWGLAVLTPCLLSIPIGAFLASRYYPKDKRMPFAFCSLILLWSILLSSLSVGIL